MENLFSHPDPMNVISPRMLFQQMFLVPYDSFQLEGDSGPPESFCQVQQREEDQQSPQDRFTATQ